MRGFWGCGLAWAIKGRDCNLLLSGFEADKSTFLWMCDRLFIANFRTQLWVIEILSYSSLP
ncbi:MAG: hypothetical protein V7L02_31500 [Nostoc sp.]